MKDARGGFTNSVKNEDDPKELVSSTTFCPVSSQVYLPVV